MHREDSAMYLLYWSCGPMLSIAGSRRRTYASVSPASPAPWTIVNTRGTYWVSVKSETGPMICHWAGIRLKIGPRAKPSAGSAKAAAAIPPAPCAVRFMKARRDTVSPSKAPGMPRSTVYSEDFL
jgi:hypothetical protein